MSRVERVKHMLQAIEYETSLAFDEHTVLLNKNQELEAENKKLRDLVDELWAIAYRYVPDESELDRARDMLRELLCGDAE